MITVIDVSKHQGNIDWARVKASGIDTAIIRCGYGDNIATQDDAKWESNYAGATANGIRVGVYIYSYATDTAHAKSEAEHLSRLIAGKAIDFGIWYDLEDTPTTGQQTAKAIGDIAQTFVNRVKELTGREVGIYANKYWFTKILTDARFALWDKWVAQYADQCTYQGEYVGWQYTSTGKIPGIVGNVDLSEFKEIAKEPTVKPSTEKPDLSGYVGCSIAGALNSRGYNSSYEYRKELAKELGIVGYKGTAEQNLRMIELLGGKVEQASETYTVQKGDTLSKIAKKYNTTWQELQKINGIADANKIYPGQVIKIK